MFLFLDFLILLLLLLPLLLLLLLLLADDVVFALLATEVHDMPAVGYIILSASTMPPEAISSSRSS
tara:strand:- start:840 stop:1037 length:198 start_codon:yes stop_codon:yes gene_type:complete